MTRVHTWLLSKARRSRRRPVLDEALLFGRQWAYARYRVRFLAVRVALRTVLHALEISLFAAVVWPEFLPYFLLLRSGMAMFGGLYWGALEQLRQEVRARWRRREWSGVRFSIDSWLRFALLLVALQLMVMAGYLRFAPSPFTSFSILDAYAIACFLRLGMDTLSRTYHAGLFAMRRVYRPLSSLLAGDVTDVAAVLLVFWWLGPWSFAPALLLGGLVRAALTMHFTRRAYGRTRIPRLSLRLFWRRPLPGLGALWVSAKYAAVNFGGQLDAWLIATLVGAGAGQSEHLQLATLFYLFRPLLGAGTVWARIFYFDFKRLQMASFELLRARFERFMRRVAWAAAISVGLLLWAVAPLIWGPRLPWDILLLLLPFCAARAWLALYQMQAFAYEMHGYLLRLGLGVLGGLFLMGLVQTDTRLAVAVLCGCLFATLYWLKAPKARARRATGLGALLGLPAWLSQLSAVSHPVRVWIASCDRRLVRPGRLAHELASSLEEARVTRFGKNGLLWYESARTDPKEPAQGHAEETRAQRAELVVRAAGCLQELTVGASSADGVLALQHAVALRPDSDVLRELLCGPRLDRSQLLERFRALFPDGQIVDLESGDLSSTGRQVDSRLVRPILIELRQLAKGQTPRRHASRELELSAYCPRGEPQLIFAAPRTADADKRTQWRHTVQRASARASL